MKLKKILSVLLILVLCIAMTACGDSDKKDSKDDKEVKKETVESGESTPLLYKVTDDDGGVIWLFGSIHVGNDSFYPLPDYVTEALDGADSLAVEFDIVAFEDDTSAQMKAITELIITDGSTVKDLVSEEIYENAKEILEDCGYYNAYLDYYMPIMWSSFIDSAFYEKIGADTELGVDRHLIDYAYENDIEVVDIESAKFQYGMMADYSEELQELLLESSIENYNDGDSDELDEMMYAWSTGDEEALIELIYEEELDFEDEEEEKLYEEYNEAMIVERNENMTDWAEEAIESGDEVFICVGAAHIVGEGAMADKLSERGYKVEIVN